MIDMNFDWVFYIHKYPHLQRAGINTKEKALRHWNNYGKNEKRICNNIQPLPTNNEGYNIIMTRQQNDYTRYHNFVNKGRNILHRTFYKRNKDSEKFIADTIQKNDIIIDFGSGLGNSNSKLAGISVHELYSNSKIKSHASAIIATDIESAVIYFKAKKEHYNILTSTINTDFKISVTNIIKEHSIQDINSIFLRSANSLDLLMTIVQTQNHFSTLCTDLRNYNVIYLFNNIILQKLQNESKFSIIGYLHNRAFDHIGKAWDMQKGAAYTLN